MAEPIIINTGPLIALGKMDAFGIIAQLPFVFTCPVQVEHEIAKGAAQGHAVSLPAWVNVTALTAPLSPLTLVSLDRGEAEVIQLALERGVATVCIDELKAVAPLRLPGCAWLVHSALLPAPKISVCFRLRGRCLNEPCVKGFFITLI